jgi:hypothetical protein
MAAAARVASGEATCLAIPALRDGISVPTAGTAGPTAISSQAAPHPRCDGRMRRSRQDSEATKQVRRTVQAARSIRAASFGFSGPDHALRHEMHGISRRRCSKLESRLEWPGRPCSFFTSKDCFGEGFRMPAADERCRRHVRPATENLRGRKPREEKHWRWGGPALWGFGWGACSVEVGWTRSVRRAGEIGRGDGAGLEGAGAVER